MKPNLILLTCILLSSACSPRVDESATQTAAMATLVQENLLSIQSSVEAAATLTIAAMPTDTATETAISVPTETPIPSSTSTPRPLPTVTIYIPLPTVALPPVNQGGVTGGNTGGGNCDPAYPTVCIPPPPPDLDCGDISIRRFQVNPPGPTRGRR